MELAISSAVMTIGKYRFSITYQITSLMFLTVALTVLLLVYLANLQMEEQFQEYLVVQHMEMRQGTGEGETGQTLAVVMGSPEHSFLTSVHQSLIWVGGIILVFGLAASYILARSITVPLRNLSQAAEQIEQGNFQQSVTVNSRDEVGHLAAIFNRMSATLATNHQLRRQLLANVAHELRTPLAIIQSHLEGMIDDVIEVSKEQLQSLHEEAVRLNHLIRDLRDLSLAEVGQLTLEKHPADINQIAQRAMQMLKPMAEDKGIRLECHFEKNLPEIAVDSNRISQVLYNLAVNAIRYSPAEKKVCMITAAVKDTAQSWVKISVADNGPGIDAEDLPHIFDTFYRGEKSRNRRSGGSGLGLAIVKQLVEIHGGSVSVNSQKGCGSAFHVLLPVEKQNE